MPRHLEVTRREKIHLAQCNPRLVEPGARRKSPHAAVRRARHACIRRRRRDRAAGEEQSPRPHRSLVGEARLPQQLERHEERAEARRDAARVASVIKHKRHQPRARHKGGPLRQVGRGDLLALCAQVEGERRGEAVGPRGREGGDARAHGGALLRRENVQRIFCAFARRRTLRGQHRPLHTVLGDRRAVGGVRERLGSEGVLACLILLLEGSALDLTAGGAVKVLLQHGDRAARRHTQPRRHRVAHFAHERSEPLGDVAELVERCNLHGGQRLRLDDEEEQQRLRRLRGVVYARRRGERRQRPSDLHRDRLNVVAVQVGAADDDHLLSAPREEEPPVADEAEVARVEPAVTWVALRVCHRVVMVAEHHAWPADLQMAHLQLVENVGAAVPRDAQLDARRRRAEVDEAHHLRLARPARRLRIALGHDQPRPGEACLRDGEAGPGTILVVVRHARARLRHPKRGLHHVRPQAQRGNEGVAHISRHLLACIHQPPQRGEVDG